MRRSRQPSSTRSERRSANCPDSTWDMPPTEVRAEARHSRIFVRQSRFSSTRSSLVGGTSAQVVLLAGQTSLSRDLRPLPARYSEKRQPEIDRPVAPSAATDNRDCQYSFRPCHAHRRSRLPSTPGRGVGDWACRVLVETTALRLCDAAARGNRVAWRTLVSHRRSRRLDAGQLRRVARRAVQLGLPARRWRRRE